MTDNTPIAKIIGLFLTGTYAVCLITYFVLGQSLMMWAEPIGFGQMVSLGACMPALLPLTASLLLTVGLIADRWIWLAWLGLLVFISTGILLIFGIGIIIFLCAALLFVPIALTHWHVSNHQRWLHIAWIGVAGLVVYGILFLPLPFGPISLGLAAVYAIWVGVLEWETSQALS